MGGNGAYWSWRRAAIRKTLHHRPDGAISRFITTLHLWNILDNQYLYNAPHPRQGDIWSDGRLVGRHPHSILIAHSLWETGLQVVMEFILSCAESLAVTIRSMAGGWIMGRMQRTLVSFEDYGGRSLGPFTYCYCLLYV